MELEIIKTSTTWNDAAGSINNNLAKVQTELMKLGSATYKNKGYFADEDALIAAFPTAGAGSKAYVGTNYPYAIYVWNNDTKAWEDSGDMGGDETVELGQYYTKDEVDEAIDNTFQVMSQSTYDALVEKDEDTIYFIYEDE